MSDSSTYGKRGVSASKEEVHAAIQKLDKGLYPMAFCKVMPDLVAGDPDYCNIMHADTAGTKTSLAWLYWKETGDESVWKGIVQDALVMNLDDMACVGCIDHILISSTIGRNKNLIPGEVLAQLIGGTSDFLERMQALGISLHLTGGETADVGDIVRTLDVGFTTFARLKRSELVVNRIQAGDVVVGLASFGQASYEDAYNAGMGSNGLTSARHDVFHHAYAGRYPESFDPALPEEVVYVGSKKLTDTLDINGQSIPVGKLVLSPTRTYLPVLKSVFNDLPREEIHGMIHCSGGGQTKVLKFLEGKKVIKDHLFPTPPLFSLIRQEAGTPWKEMYQVFNMGHRLEIYLPEARAERVIEIAQSFGVDARIIGRVEDSGRNEVLVKQPEEGTVFSYR